MPPEPEKFFCIKCTAEFGMNPRLEKLLSGKSEFKELGQMCWVCARLTNSLQLEAAQMKKEFALSEEM